jgi:hypothetical protein
LAALRLPDEDAMEQYALEEVMSGTEESCLWVTLGFRSELEKNDVLHIVCATTVDPRDRNGRMADLYLERFDQAYSCYGGADLVVATPSFVEVRMNDKVRRKRRLLGTSDPTPFTSSDSVSTILEIDPSIGPYLDSPSGTAFEREEASERFEEIQLEATEDESAAQ